eukprot:scaffold431_cov334-Pavlova_lutheri.AAC.35
MDTGEASDGGESARADAWVGRNEAFVRVERLESMNCNADEESEPMLSKHDPFRVCIKWEPFAPDL